MTQGSSSRPTHVPSPSYSQQQQAAVPSSSSSPQSKANLKAWWKQFTFTQRAGKKESVPFNPKDDSVHTVFGVPLHESLHYASVPISTANADGQLYVWGNIPAVVAKCGLYLKENATEVEGTFRVNGSSKRMRELQALFENPPRYGKNLDWSKESYTPHDVASVFRRYLTQMPEPVIPYNLYSKFREPLAKKRSDEEVRNTFRQLIRSMPRPNQCLLLYVLDLLSVFARKSDKNLMTVTNLAVIFRPGLISHPNHEMSLKEYQLSQNVLEFLIEHQDWFMLDPTPPQENAQDQTDVVEGDEVAAFPLSEWNGKGHGKVLSDAASGWKLVERAQPSFGSAIEGAGNGSGGNGSKGGKVGRRRSSSASGLQGIGGCSGAGPSGSGAGDTSAVSGNGGGSVSLSRSRTLPSARGSSGSKDRSANPDASAGGVNPEQVGGGTLSSSVSSSGHGAGAHHGREGSTSTSTLSGHGTGRNVLKKHKRTSLPPAPARSVSSPSGHGASPS